MGKFDTTRETGNTQGAVSSSSKPGLEIAQPQSLSQSEPITVLLADDHNIVREGLRLLLESAGDIKVVGEAENGRQAVQQARDLSPQVVVLDLAMPLLNGVEALRQIVKEMPHIKVLILSSYNDDQRVLQLLKEGATGYLVKQTAVSDLLSAVREAKKGNAYLSPSISKRLSDDIRRNFALHGSHGKPGNKSLTNREAEVLQLIAEGYANKQIAAELSISIKTVEKHRQQVMNKLNLHDVAGLTRHAFTHGIIETPPQLPES
jgi:DNA-binding NarL/FixJ family response regulator